jgi:hypothetical protein
MSYRFFRAPVASYDEANVFLTALIQVGDGTWLGPSNVPTRPIINALVYWPQNYDPQSTGEQVMKETFASRYVSGELAPEYPAPADVEEVTQQAYIDAKNTAFPPDE